MKNILRLVYEHAQLSNGERGLSLGLHIHLLQA